MHAHPAVRIDHWGSEEQETAQIFHHAQTVAKLTLACSILTEPYAIWSASAVVWPSRRLYAEPRMSRQRADSARVNFAMRLEASGQKQKSVQERFPPWVSHHRDIWPRLGIPRKNFNEKPVIDLNTISDNTEELGCPLHRPSARLRVVGASVLLNEVLQFRLIGGVLGERVYT